MNDLQRKFMAARERDPIGMQHWAPLQSPKVVAENANAVTVTHDIAKSPGAAHIPGVGVSENKDRLSGLPQHKGPKMLKQSKL